MNMRKIYLLGNPLVDADSLPLKIAKSLQKEFPAIEFAEFDPTEDLPEEMIAIDTVIGIDKVKVIDNIDDVINGKIYSLHDFDIGFNLKLMKKLGRMKNVKIIGIPAGLTEDEAVSKVSEKIRSL